VQEHVRYVRVAPPPTPAPTPQVAVVPPPTVKIQPVVTPPLKPLEITPEAKSEPKIEIAKIAEATAPVVGVGGGTGRDGSAGNGPGSGGGVVWLFVTGLG
jgi:protein TonB